MRVGVPSAPPPPRLSSLPLHLFRHLPPRPAAAVAAAGRKKKKKEALAGPAARGGSRTSSYIVLPPRPPTSHLLSMTTGRRRAILLWRPKGPTTQRSERFFWRPRGTKTPHHRKLFPTERPGGPKARKRGGQHCEMERAVESSRVGCGDRSSEEGSGSQLMMLRFQSNQRTCWSFDPTAPHHHAAPVPMASRPPLAGMMNIPVEPGRSRRQAGLQRAGDRSHSLPRGSNLHSW